MKRRQAFTLIELMVSLALVALVIIGLNTFIFSMSELWGKGRDWRLFDQHVRAVTRFLQQELRGASMPPAVSAGQTAIRAAEVEVQSGRRAKLVTFGLREGSRILEWPERPLPDVWCALEVRQGEGLVLYWQSALEEDFEDEMPREIVLTPLVTKLAYDYYDPEFNQWETEDALKTGDNLELETPDRLRLTFTYRGREVETLVQLPLVGKGLPAF